jgi:hypothetical protein
MGGLATTRPICSAKAPCSTHANAKTCASTGCSGYTRRNPRRAHSQTASRSSGR